ncbi:MAG: hypothetical protein FWH40_08445 [Coriobacteriia bacterium]|nr:hypothetical protein [Coriobacteriia bacterium]
MTNSIHLEKPMLRLLTRKSIVMLVSLSLMTGALASLGGCKSTAVKTYAVKKWEDVQSTIDNAKSNDIIDLSKLTTPAEQCTMVFPQAFNCTVIGNPDEVFLGLAIVCPGENSLTIENLRIASTGNQASSTIQFSSWGNQLVLQGVNEVTNAQAPEELGCGAAIGVPEGATLTFSGTGYLKATGGSGAAGIGGGRGITAGTIVVREGNITALGGNTDYESNGAGIGGGAHGKGGSVTISGGTVTAIGGFGSAGIGGGYNADGGSITISGGDVTAISNANSEAQAINCSLEALPGSYTWWAGGSDAAGLAEGKSFPEEAFSNNANYKYVRIKA